MALERKCLIITGMHRSNTSLVAKAFHEAGLYLGPELIGPLESNIHGHFEEKSIVDFHNKLIQELGLQSHWTVINGKKARNAKFSQEHQETAGRLINKTFYPGEFGWKDPRAPFFLNLWDKVINQSYYCFVVRDPVQCVYSLLRRRYGTGAGIFRPFLAWKYFNLWDQTNQCIRSFVHYKYSNCLVTISPDIYVQEDCINRLNETLISKWQFEIMPLNFQNIIDPALIGDKNIPVYLRFLCSIRRKTQRIYRDLRKISKDQLG